MGKTALILGLGALVGCHPNDEVPAPELDGARSYLLFGVEEIGGAPAIPNAPEYNEHRVVLAQAYDLASAPASATFIESDTLDLYALPYACPLADLGLSFNAIALAEAPATTAPLPRSTSPQSDLAGDVGWLPLMGEVPTVLDNVLMRLMVSGDRCARMAPSYAFSDPIDLDLFRAYPTFVLPLPGAVLIGATDGTATLLDQSLTSTVVPIPGVDRPMAAQVAADGEVWFLSFDGQILKGPIFGEKRAYPGLATQEAVRDFAERLVGFIVTRESDPIEAYLVTQDRSLQRYDGSGWAELSRGADREWRFREGRVYFSPQIIAAGPGRVATFGETDLDSSVIMVSGDRVTESVVTSRDAFVSQLLYHPTLGLLASDSRGRTFADGGSAWVERLPVTRQESDVVTAMVRDATGFWRATGRSMSSVHPDTGKCSQPHLDFVPVRYLEVDADRWFVVGVDPESGVRLDESSPNKFPDTHGYWMTRAKASSDCSIAF